MLHLLLHLAQEFLQHGPLALGVHAFYDLVDHVHFSTEDFLHRLIDCVLASDPIRVDTVCICKPSICTTFTLLMSCWSPEHVVEDDCVGFLQIESFSSNLVGSNKEANIWIALELVHSSLSLILI